MSEKPTIESVHLAHHADRVVDKMTFGGDFICTIYCYCGAAFQGKSWVAAANGIDAHLDHVHEVVS